MSTDDANKIDKSDQAQTQQKRPGRFRRFLRRLLLLLLVIVIVGGGALIGPSFSAYTTWRSAETP